MYQSNGIYSGALLPGIVVSIRKVNFPSTYIFRIFTSDPKVQTHGPPTSLVGPGSVVSRSAPELMSLFIIKLSLYSGILSVENFLIVDQVIDVVVCRYYYCLFHRDACSITKVFHGHEHG